MWHGKDTKDGAVGDVSEALASLPQPILPKPPRPFNVADYDEGEDAKLKSEAKQAMPDASEALASLPQPILPKPPRPFNVAGLLQIEDDDVGPDRAFFMEEDAATSDAGVKARAKIDRVEQIHNEEVGLPSPMIGDEEAGGNGAYFKRIKAKAKKDGRVEEVHDDAGPTHYASIAPSAGDERKKKAAIYSKGPGAGIQSNEPQPSTTSIIVPTEEDMADGAALDPAIGRKRRTRGDEGGAVDVELGGNVEPLQLEDEEPFNSELPILQARLVEEDEMVISGHAEPVPPWWKERRTKQLMALLALVLVAAIAIGVGLGTRPVPEASPMVVSAATEPTSSPTSCSFKISKTMQTLDKLPVTQPGYTIIAADSSNLILVTRDVKATEADSVYLIFYSWNDDAWELKNFIIEEADDNGLLFSADISGGTALVGFPNADDGAGVVYSYRQNSQLFWGKEATPILPDDGPASSSKFGDAVNVDGDLACVSAEEGGDQGSVVYLFSLMMNDKWVQIEDATISAPPGSLIDSCFVSGETIAVKIHEGDLTLYLYDRESSKVLPLQEPLVVNSIDGQRIGATALSGKHLLYTVEQLGFYGYLPVELRAYQRQESGSFGLVQHLNSSDYEEKFGSSFDLGADFLVVRGTNRTYLFAEENDLWKEQESMIDQPYENYQVSARSIVAVTERSEIVAYNVEGCIQSMPTQIPSISVAPSPVSSQVPSRVTFPPSSSPTLSFTPTESCYWVELLIEHDPYPDEVSWEVRSVLAFGGGGDAVAASTSTDGSDGNAGLSFDDDSNERFCMPEGTYQFVIRDSGGDGICCLYGSGSYTLKSKGLVLARGGEFESSETKTFSVPAQMSLDDI